MAAEEKGEQSRWPSGDKHMAHSSAQTDAWPLEQEQGACMWGRAVDNKKQRPT